MSLMTDKNEDPKRQCCNFVCEKNVTENSTAYFCEKPEKPCAPYNVSGRKAYRENFRRHVMCVQVCHFVEKAERSSAISFSLSSATKDPCTAIRRKNGCFDVFNKCAFRCDGWTNRHQMDMRLTSGPNRSIDSRRITLQLELFSCHECHLFSYYAQICARTSAVYQNSFDWISPPIF
ncbi:hypothetical protein SprV_0702456200 [Sparganum proliferum]